MKKFLGSGRSVSLCGTEKKITRFSLSLYCIFVSLVHTCTDGTLEKKEEEKKKVVLK